MGHHTIDGFNFEKGALRMIENGNWLVSLDTFHSVLMQVVLSWVYRLDANPFWFHSLNFLVLVAVCLLSWQLYRRCFPNPWQYVAWGFLGLCGSLSYYSAMLQYEILLMATLTVASLGLVRFSEGKIWPATTGIAFFIAAAFRPHYVLWAVFATARAFRQREKNAGILLTVFVGLTVVWSTLYTVQLRKPYFFWDLTTGFPMHRSLSSASLGVSFPKSVLVEGGGPLFVLREPHNYVALLGRRSLFLTDFNQSVWHVPTIWERLAEPFGMRVFVRQFFALLATGLFLFGWRLVRAPWSLALLGPIVPILALMLIINSSFRYLLPCLVQLVALQMIGLKAVVERVQRYRYPGLSRSALPE